MLLVFMLQDEAEWSAKVLDLKVENAGLVRAEGSLRAQCSSLQKSVSNLEAGMRQLEADTIKQHEQLEQQKLQVMLG